jgi:hypothetical protein
MEKYTNEGTSKTPTINFSLNEGILEIKGRSIPENSIEFYKPLMTAIDTYSTSVKPATTLNIHLEYFNTSSSKCILDVFKRFESIAKNGNSIIINWNYEEEDDDMLEAGQDYQAMVNLPFKMVPVAG